MTNMVEPFIRFIHMFIALFTALATAFGGTAGPSTEDVIRALDADSVKLTVALVSDVHINSMDTKSVPTLKNATADMANADKRIDVFVDAGDSTENSMPEEWDTFYDILYENDPADNYVIAEGNHDIRLRPFEQTKALFLQNYRRFTGIAPTEYYFAVKVKDYTFIVLGSERATFEENYISDTQLAWLDAQLEQATLYRQPVFVVLHQPLKNTHGLPMVWASPSGEAGSVGPQSDQIRRILNKYKGVFLITGHTHTGLGEYTYEQIGNFRGVNLPTMGKKNDHGLEQRGTGLMMEVYKDKIVFRARDFASGKYLPEYDLTVEL